MLTGIIGRRETGKTTLAMYLARSQRFARCLVFDSRNGIHPRAGGLKVYDMETMRALVYPRLVQGHLREIIFTPRDPNLSAAFLDWSQLVMRHVEYYPTGKLVIVIDEAALVKDDLERLDHPLQAAMRWCKRDHVHFFLTCHQPKNLPTNTRAISDYLIFFHATQEHDLRVIADRCSESFAADVATLPPHEFLIWNDQKGEALRPAIDPTMWKLDLAESAPVLHRGTTVDLGALWR